MPKEIAMAVPNRTSSPPQQKNVSGPFRPQNLEQNLLPVFSAFP
jgi:hypothetical protein